MWTAQHTSTSSRSSAKNIDLRLAMLKDPAAEEQQISYPHPSEMWLGKHQRSSQSSSSERYSVPSLSPRSSSFAHEDNDDDVMSQASGSTAFSTTLSPAERQREGSVHVHILSADKYEPASMHVDVEAEMGEDVSVVKSFFQQDQISLSMEAFQSQESSFIDRPRNTARAIDHQPPSPATSKPTTEEQSEPEQVPNPGPLQTQLQSLLTKIAILETQSPTIMASDYTSLQSRIATLESEKASLLSNRESLFSLRDEDVQNLIKLRVLLAQERREHEALRKLRDDDLQNVIQLRNKLAQATWSSKSQNRLSSGSFSSAGSPSVGSRRMEKTQSLSQNNDLWQTAKTAALEQRVLELESANADLRGRLDNALQQSQREQEISFIAATTNTGDNEQGMAALTEMRLNAMRERESHVAEIKDVKAENVKLKQQVEKMKFQLETSQAVIECFSRTLKVN
ncbi:hypothetical protein TSTA_013240 [Talaromyces stipitatus ATCC 10500]|uniref:Uncharacterized protein n=1 Tax=Talaromyces stipitatus (strain ATCC 10500 / CBS 375.48 / QM 6759 / NRRL 1006) TaxID=441959 RepID=B8MG98_TALSN|nr:uncharacterized protein TSTA_013240 [Talaromyces stipitatus ATCC 10500]EED16218.1 hypothetical protein TSTA_013240 [Talaromyces stipitatus ATCC 10500]